MEFRILGPLEVLDEGRRVALPGSKQRTLLALLLLHRGETLSTERSIDELWGERPPATAAKAVRVRISRLRKALAVAGGEGAEGLVLTREHGYELALDPEQLDAHRFERLVAEGRNELDGGRPQDAAAALEEALSMWRGRPLEDLAYEPFAQPAIARLEDLQIVALEQLIDAKLALGRHAEVVGRLERLIADHPYRERLRAQLMLALYRCERQADALQAYQDARRALVEELGIEPGERLRELERSILAQEPALAAPATPLGVDAGGPDASAGTALAPAPHELPTGVVTFLFSDVEGSTRLLTRLRGRYAEVLGEHQRLLRAEFDEHDGREVHTEGDAFFVAFARASDAIAAAVGAQRSLASRRWPEGVEVRVRMGVHTGEAEVRLDDYVGFDVHRAARICAAGHGGQVLISSSTRELVADELPGDVAFRDLGEHRLKDLDRAEHLFQLVVGDLPADFPALASLSPGSGGANGLPPSPNRTIGRADDVQAIVDRLRVDGVRLLTPHRPGRGGQDAPGARGGARGEGGLRGRCVLRLACRAAAARGCARGHCQDARDRRTLGRVCRPGRRALPSRQAPAAGGRQLRAPAGGRAVHRHAAGRLSRAHGPRHQSRTAQPARRGVLPRVAAGAASAGDARGRRCAGRRGRRRAVLRASARPRPRI